MMGKLAFLIRSCHAPHLWFVGILAALSPANAVAQDVAQSFTLHQEPRLLGEIHFEDGDGNTLSLADFQGKAIVLNVWATWCAPCVREMPTLDRLQAQLGGANFEVVALSIDRAGLEVVRKFYDVVGVQHLAIYIDRLAKTMGTLSVVGLPTTLLIDRKGREIGRLVGPAEWDSTDMVEFLKSHFIDKTSAQRSNAAAWISGNTEWPLIGRPNSHLHRPNPQLLTFQSLATPYFASAN